MGWMGEGVPEIGIGEIKNEAPCHVGSLQCGGY